MMNRRKSLKRCRKKSQTSISKNQLLADAEKRCNIKYSMKPNEQEFSFPENARCRIPTSQNQTHDARSDHALVYFWHKLFSFYSFCCFLYSSLYFRPHTLVAYNQGSSDLASTHLSTIRQLRS